MEWKSSTDKEKYGDMIGEVVHHTLYEDGSITNYDVKFGNKTIKNIPATRLESVQMQEHSHSPTNAGTPDDEEKNILHGDTDVEEGIIGALAGTALAAPPSIPGATTPGMGIQDWLKMAAGGYFGHKIQNYIKTKKAYVKDDESK
tara:strand:- start:1024 stop:1458 length:435 start_codon:yes stop_codon:yes gene_type:complete